MPLLPETRTLFVAELFDVILDSLAEPRYFEPSFHDRGIQVRAPDADGQRALAALAQTCRAFSEPALNHLWRKLGSLEPLLRCFTPRAALASARRGLRPPTEVDWAVINRYSHRIQELEVQNDCSCAFLECVIFESALLPNLRVLKWKTQANLNTIGITYIQPLLVPGLLVLDVGATERDMALGSFLKACPLRCPRLMTIGFHIHMHGKELVDILSQSLCSFENLKCLDLEAPVNDSALQQVLLSSELQELTLQLRKISFPSSDTPLRNVKKLDLSLDGLHLMAELLRPGNQSFREIKLHLDRLEFATAIGTLLGELASHSEKSPLQSLHLDTTMLHSYLNDCMLFVLSFDTLRPLTSLTNLRELTIRLENSIALNDEELANLACNWPLLEVIELCYSQRLRVKHITFKGLLTLVAICPKLHAVGLTLSGRKVPRGVAMGLGRNMITSLRFPNSPVDNPRLVAEFLLTHFPTVPFSETDRWGLAGAVDRHEEEWAKVRAYLADASVFKSTEPVAGSG